MLLFIVVYMFGYASGPVVTVGESAVAVTFGKVSGTVITDFVIRAFMNKTTTESDL